jgi:hypothetical protein
MKKFSCLQIVFCCILLYVNQVIGQVMPGGQVIPGRIIETEYKNQELVDFGIMADTMIFQDSLWLRKKISGLAEDQLSLLEEKTKSGFYELLPELPADGTPEEIYPQHFLAEISDVEKIDQAKNHFQERMPALQAAMTEVEKVKSDLLWIKKTIYPEKSNGSALRNDISLSSLSLGARFSPDLVSGITGILSAGFAPNIRIGAGYIYNLKSRKVYQSWNGLLMFLNFTASKGLVLCFDIERLNKKMLLSTPSVLEHPTSVSWHIFPGIRKTIYSFRKLEVYTQLGIDLLHRNNGAYREPISGKVGVTWEFISRSQ